MLRAITGIMTIVAFALMASDDLMVYRLKQELLQDEARIGQLFAVLGLGGLLDSDDLVGIFLDPFNDGRRGYAFLVNPLGVQQDLIVDDVSGTQDLAWDALWESAGQLRTDGFEVELAIPWSELRFPALGKSTGWRFDAFRFYPRRHLYRLAWSTLEHGRDFTLCQFVKVKPPSDLTPGHHLQLMPTVTGQLSHTGGLQAGSLDEGHQASIEPGLTMRWGLTPGLSLSAAVNPDFSQVEADALQLGVNKPVALY